MMDADLGDGISATGRTRENFGIDQRAGAPHLDVVKNPVLVEFEGAVDVFELYAEEEADKTDPAPGVELPEQAVLTIEAEATDDVIYRSHRAGGGRDHCGPGIFRETKIISEAGALRSAAAVVAAMNLTQINQPCGKDSCRSPRRST
jgi:hypothetical protein